MNRVIHSHTPWLPSDAPPDLAWGFHAPPQGSSRGPVASEGTRESCELPLDHAPGSAPRSGHMPLDHAPGSVPRSGRIGSFGRLLETPYAWIDADPRGFYRFTRT